MGSRIVGPDTTKLDLSDGDWILIKRRLNAGEQRAYLARVYQSRANGTVTVDPLQIGLSLCLAYLLDWSLTGLDGKPLLIRDQSMEIKASILDSLDPDTFGEIRQAIDDHAARMQAERDSEKNGRDGETASSTISPSRVGVIGGTSGLLN